MTALNNSYNTMQNSLKGNYNSTLGQLEQNYNTGVAGVNKQADNAQQQAYINYMMLSLIHISCWPGQRKGWA